MLIVACCSLIPISEAKRLSLEQNRLSLRERVSKERCSISQNVNLVKHFGMHFGKNLTKVNMHIPFNTAIPLLGIFLKKTIRSVQRCIYMFVRIHIKSSI